MYTCQYCGKSFETPIERAECEVACYKTKVAEETEAKKKAALAEREAAQKEINGLLDEYEELRAIIENKVAAYNKKYGIPYKTDKMIDDLFDVFSPFGGFRW